MSTEPSTNIVRGASGDGNSGSFFAHIPSRREVPDFVSGPIGLHDDVRGNIDQDGYVFANESTVVSVRAVYPGADGVIIGTDDDGNYVATAEFTDVNMLAYACAVNGWEYEDEDNEASEAQAVAWLDCNAPAITAFLESRGVESSGDKWGDDRFTVTVPLTSEVTFERAGVALNASAAAVYIRDGLASSSMDEGLNADLHAFIAAYPHAA